MALIPGTRLGVYEITALLGEGGMGQVYRGTDIKLKRQVAIKILPPALAADADRLARFQREAEVLASLNHPNIAGIYGLEEGGGMTALVMELVDGDDLSQRIAKGAIPLDEALPIATQIAEALEAAHVQGIIHRDLKPANIKVRADGTVKVLDFGLAKAMEPAAGSSPSMSMSPTITTPAMTQAGMILGTAAYMSPEQAKGRTVDRRADVWAFGCVLFEMLAGTRAFAGDDVSEVLASVLAREPDWARLPPTLSPALATFIRRCLNKNPKQRIGDVQDVRLALEGAFETAAPQTPLATAPRPCGGPAWVACAAAFVGMVALAIPAVRHLREAPTPAQRAAQFDVPSPTTYVGAFALSPDGRYLVMSGAGPNVGASQRSRLWVRPIDALDARELPGTEGAAYPFWSPDSANIGFFANGKLKKVALTGGEVQTLCDADGTAGGNWGPTGTILFPLISLHGLGRVAAAGGNPTAVTTAAGPADFHKYPEWLPDGRHFLYLLVSDDTAIAGIYVGSMDGTPPVRLLPDQSNAAYVPASAAARDGHVLFRRGTTLMAMPFNAEQLKAAGEMFPVAQGVAVAGNAAHAGFSASTTGTLVYVSGSATQQQVLVFLDRSGTRLGALARTGLIRTFTIAPDDLTVAVSMSDPQAGTTDLWLADVARNAASRFTSVVGAGSSVSFPVWSPDGKRIAFSIRPPNSSLRDLYWQAANGTGQPELLSHATGNDMGPFAWSHDGKFLVFAQFSTGGTRRDIWVLPLSGDRKPVACLNTVADEDFPQLSPDSRWMAYASDESGQAQVYIEAIPRNGVRVQVSAAGGSQPRWRGDGKELFYVSADQQMMAASIQVSSASIEAGRTKTLFKGAPETVPEFFQYQPTADGQRFLVSASVNEGAPPRLTLVLNWRARSGN